jgi:hypothetical protein
MIGSEVEAELGDVRAVRGISADGETEVHGPG